MANPIYHADPEFYERPGETVHLEVDQHPSMFTVPALPWRDRETPPRTRGLLRSLPDHWEPSDVLCSCCGKPLRAITEDQLAILVDGRRQPLCPHCARAQARDETFKARANMPQPSRPRIAIREGWESWASEQPRTEDTSLESGHVRPYETRIG